MRSWCRSRGWTLFLASALTPIVPTFAALPEFDFRTPAGAAGWQALHDLAPLTRTAEGLRATLRGSDPYFAGPPRDYPTAQPLWLNLRLRSETGGTCQVFYFRDDTGATERASVRFGVRGGDWVTARVPLEPLGPRFRLRVDPPGESGVCLFERLWFEERRQYPEPSWPQPTRPDLASGHPSLSSGDLELTHHPSAFGGFVIKVAGQEMAFGQTRPLLGYVTLDGPRWWPFAEAAKATVQIDAQELSVALSAVDPDGARWQFQQSFRISATSSSIEVSSSLTTDQDRALLYFPPLTLFTGTPQGGTNKQQALLAGVEYLANEPSSSEADLEGPQARRQVTDTSRLTFPLAALVAGDRYLALAWDMQPHTSVLFDSPDRFFHSDRHLIGLLFPGSDGVLREEGSLIPYDTLRLAANQSLEARAVILGGPGSNAVAAVRHYVALRDLPIVPSPGSTPTDYCRLTARGWLDSAIREGDRYKHAAGGGTFAPQPAADAAYMMDWLALRVDDSSLAGRLRTAAAGALAQVPANQRFDSGVGHVRFPAAPLLYGSVAENAGTALIRGRSLLGRFDGDGTIRYVGPVGGIDYGRTHWTNEANGLTAQVVATILRDAAFSGDASLQASGLRHLRALAKFRGTVPRGAQTWEIPLHTPDILASAHLVDACLMGYEATGEPAFLDDALYWAWTGVPFVYLRSPVDGPVGPYATIPVLGATQWLAPNWIGLPVQWCGLVYADALYRLAQHDPDGPWRQLADGITASGIQQTYPESNTPYLGLLPDSFTLKAQQRNPANINPGTLLACATRLLGYGPLYDSHTFRHHGVQVHVAGEIRDAQETSRGFGFRVHAWPTGRHRLLLNGVTAVPVLRIGGRPTPIAPPHSHAPLQGRLILEIEGSPNIEIDLPAKSALRIERSLSPETAVLSWSSNLPFNLESSPTLNSPPFWTPVAAAPALDNNRWSLAVPVTSEPGRLFRLRRSGG